MCTMGMDMMYFAAPDDRVAAEVESRAGNLSSHPEVSGFSSRGYDPMVNLGTLESILRGVPFESLEQDPRWGGGVGPEDPDQMEVVLTITDTLRDALAGTEDAALERAADAWSRTEELNAPGWEEVTVADHLEFLDRLRVLARSAVAADHRLYCFIAL